MRLYILFLLVMLTGLSACSQNAVKPWQKQDLARSEMQLNGNSIEAGYEDHFYFSKEGSAGGRNFSGGGCGCN